jgi:ferredoxin-NADP reductase
MPDGYDVAFIEQELCGSDIVTCRFEKPEGYSFAAGQWLSLRLETSDGPATHVFSHCSAPRDPVLELTTRLSGSVYKQALGRLEPGQRVHIVGPGGRLAIGDDVQRIAFLAGGIGITPIRSILRDAAQKGRTFDDALLLYGNRDESCVPFLAEFEAMADMGVRIVLVYERPPEMWDGESGFITADIVRRHVDLDDGRPFVVTGPPVMVTAIERVLDELHLAAERRLIERFGAAK